MPSPAPAALELTPRSKLLPWLLVGIGVYAAYGHWLAPLGPKWAVGADLMYMPFRITAAVVMWLASRTSKYPRIARGWRLLAAGEAFQVVGNATWVYADATGADINEALYLAWTIPAGVLWIGALWTMLRETPWRDTGASDWADAAILVCAAATVAWYFVAARYIAAEAETPWTITMFLSDETLTFSTCFFAVAVWLRSPAGLARGASSRLWVSWVLIALLDLVFEWLTIDGTYVAGNPIDVAYALAVVLSIVGAEKQWRRPEGDPPGAPERVTRGDVIVFGAVAVALVPLIFEVARTPVLEHPMSATALGVVVLMLLVLWRQRIARREVSHLIAGRLRLEQQLWQAQKQDAVGRLAAGIAHDFNNILAGISAHSQLLRSGASADVYGETREIEFATQRAAVLVKRLLAFSRAAPAAQTAVVVGDTVSAMQAMLRQLVVDDVAVHVTIEDDGAVVRLGDGQLEQIVLNLAINARDATPPGGSVSVATSRRTVRSRDDWHRRGLIPGPWAVIEVRDTGTGMDDATRAQIFQPFFTTKGGSGGSGLGLATVLGIVEAAGGVVLVDTAPGEGTTMTVCLPISPDAVPASRRDAAPMAAEGRTGTVLVVDDEIPIRTALARYLERAGHRVLIAADPSQALSEIAQSQEPVDVLVTDLRMPEMSGVELAEAARRRHPDLQVIYMSGYADAMPRRNGAPVPAGDVLDKPFDLDLLTALVSAKMRGARA